MGAMDERRFRIEGSVPNHAAGARWSSIDPDEPLDVTIVMRRPADDSDWQAVRSFATQHGLKITTENVPGRSVHAAGTADQMEKAFGCQLGLVEEPGHAQSISYQGSISLPPELQNVVVAVLGLDRRAIARR
jgi:hypothetical protein